MRLWEDAFFNKLRVFFLRRLSVEKLWRRNLIACLFERQLCRHPQGRIQDFTQQGAALSQICRVLNIYS